MYEHAYYGRALELVDQKKYADAIQLLVEAKDWPEHLGVGKPFDPDDRIPNYLIAHVNKKMGNSEKAREYFKLVANQSRKMTGKRSPLHYLGVNAMQHLEDEISVAKFIQQLQESEHRDSKETKWVVSEYSMNGGSSADKSERILQDHPIFQKIVRLIN